MMNANHLMANKSDTDYILDDLLFCYKGNEPRGSTCFFAAVSAGNVRVVQDVVEKLKRQNRADVIHWLFENCTKPSPVNSMSLWKRRLLFPGVTILMVIATPIFYLLNSIMNFMKTKYDTSYSCSAHENLTYPLFFAVLSGSREMIDYFLKNSIKIHGKDARGNNIFHVIADYSITNVQHAMKCYQAVKTFVPQELTMAKFRRMLSMKKNDESLTAVEYACKRGNLELAMMMLEDSSECFLSAGEDMLYIPGNVQIPTYRNALYYDRDNHPHRTTDGVRIVEMDSHHCDIDKLLNFVYDRKLSSYSNDELYCTHMNSVANQQIRKTQQRKFLAYIALNLTVEILLFVVLYQIYDPVISGRFLQLYLPNKFNFVNEHVKVFLQNWNSSTIVTDAVLQNQFFSANPNIFTLLNENYTLDYKELLGVIQRTPGYENYNLNQFGDLYDSLCVTGSNFFQVGELAFLDNCSFVVSELFLPMCRESGAQYDYYFKDQSWDPYEFIVSSVFLGNIYRENSNTKFTLSVAVHISPLIVLVGVYWAMYFLLDVVYRSKTILFEERHLFYKVHGSSVKAQVKICCFITYYILLFSHLYVLVLKKPDLSHEAMKDDLLTFDRNNDYLLLTSYQGITETLLFVFHFVCVLQAFICIPGIGTFVIAIFRVAIDFAKFVLIYLLTLWLFSILFATFIRDEQCPAKNHVTNGDTSILNSFYTGFAVSVGQVFLESENIKFAFLMDFIINSFLTINVIIAVMKETTNIIQREPWATHENNSWVYTEYSGIRHYLLTLLCCCCQTKNKVEEDIDSPQSRSRHSNRNQVKVIQIVND